MSQFELSKSTNGTTWLPHGTFAASGPKAAVDKASYGLRDVFPHWQAKTVANRTGKCLGRMKRFEYA